MLDIYNLNQIIDYDIDENNVNRFSYYFSAKDIDYIISILNNNQLDVNIYEYKLQNNMIIYKSKYTGMVQNTYSFEDFDNKMYYSDFIKINFYDKIQIINNNQLNTILFIGEYHDTCKEKNNINSFINSNLSILNKIKLQNDLYIERELIDLEDEDLEDIYGECGFSIKNFRACNNSQDSIDYDACFDYTWYNLTDIRNYYSSVKIDNSVINYLIIQFFINFSYDENEKFEYIYKTFNIYIPFFYEDITIVNNQIINYDEIIDKSKLSTHNSLDNPNNNNLKLIDILKYLNLDTNVFSKSNFYSYLKENLVNLGFDLIDKYYDQLYNFINNYYGIMFYIIFFDNRIYKINPIWQIVDSIRTYFLNPNNQRELELFMYYFIRSPIYFNTKLIKSLSLFYYHIINFINSQNKDNYILQNINILHNNLDSIITSLSVFLFDINTISRVNNNPIYKTEVSKIYETTSKKYSIIYSGSFHSMAIYRYFMLYNILNANPTETTLDLLNKTNSETIVFSLQNFQYNPNLYINTNLDNKYLSFRDIFIDQYKFSLINKLNIIKQFIINSNYTIKSIPDRSEEFVLSRFTNKRISESKNDIDLYKNLTFNNIGYYGILLFEYLDSNRLYNKKLIDQLLKQFDIIPINKLNMYAENFINNCIKATNYNVYNLIENNKFVNCIIKNIIINFTDIIFNNRNKINVNTIINEKSMDVLDDILFDINEKFNTQFTNIKLPQKYNTTTASLKSIKYHINKLYKLILLNIIFCFYKVCDPPYDQENYNNNIQSIYDYFVSYNFIKQPLDYIIKYEVEDIPNNPLQYSFNQNISEENKNKLNYYNTIIKYTNSFYN